MFFTKHIKDIILKNIDNTKYYKSYINKKYMLDFNYKVQLQQYSEKYNSNNIINDINNIEKFRKKWWIFKTILNKE